MINIAGPKPPVPRYGQPVLPNLNVKHLCPNCRTDPPNIIEEYSKGDLVCGDCGTILGDRIVDTRSEWRTFAGDEGGDDPSRVGDAGNALLNNNLDTAISGLDGRTGMSATLQRAQARAKAQNGGTGRTTNATLQAVFTRITESCETLQLPRAVANRAQHIYKIADERKFTKGKTENSCIAACIVLASRLAADGTTRTLFEIGEFMQVSKGDLGKLVPMFEKAVKDYQAKKGVAPVLGTGNTTRMSVDGLIQRYSNNLGLDQSIINIAMHVAPLASQKANVDGRNPRSIAGGVLYFTCILVGHNVGVKELEAVGRVSSSTIKLICKMIASKVDDVIKPEWKEQYPKGYSSLANLGRPKSASSRNSPSGTPGPNAPNNGTNGQS